MPGPLAAARLAETERGSNPAHDSSPSRLRRIVDDDYDFLWRSLRHLGVRDAEDAAQRILLVVARRLGDIKPGSERAFLFGAAMRTASDVRRLHARRSETDQFPVSLASREPLPDEALENRRKERILEELLDAMPLEQRTVFVLFELEGMTTPEIASVVAIAEGTVASRLRRARQTFHRLAARVQARTEPLR